MALRADLTFDVAWTSLIRDIKEVDQKIWYKLRGRVLRDCRGMLSRVVAEVPLRPLSGMPTAQPRPYVKLNQRASRSRRRPLISVGITGLGWTQAADLVEKQGRFRSAVDARYGPPPGASRWVLPAIDAETPALMRAIHEHMREISLEVEDALNRSGRRGR